MPAQGLSQSRWKPPVTPVLSPTKHSAPGRPACHQAQNSQNPLPDPNPPLAVAQPLLPSLVTVPETGVHAVSTPSRPPCPSSRQPHSRSLHRPCSPSNLPVAVSTEGQFSTCLFWHFWLHLPGPLTPASLTDRSCSAAQVRRPKRRLPLKGQHPRSPPRARSPQRSSHIS